MKYPALLLGCTLLLSACAAPSSTSRPERLRIALCQLRCVDGEREANLARVEAALEAAARDGARIACFPETCLLGWVNPAAHDLAEPIPGPTSDRLAALARRHEMMIAIGLAEKAGEDLYDSALLFDVDGTILLRHRKVNILTELMDPPYRRGDGAASSTVATRYGRIGMLVCADTFVDELLGEIAAATPDLLLVPYGWAAPADQWPEHGRSLEAFVTHAARRVDAPVVGTDVVGEISQGPWRGFHYGGQSLACDRTGTVLVRLADREAEVRTIEIELPRR